MGPITGPLIDLEYDSVVSGLRDRYECGALSTGDYVLALLVISLGPRPLQLAALKLRDLVVGKGSAGSDVYLLRIADYFYPADNAEAEKILESFFTITSIPVKEKRLALLRKMADEFNLAKARAIVNILDGEMKG
jgi:hypothetical protein